MVELKRKAFRDFDFVVLLAPVVLTVFGCIGIYSTTPSTDMWKKQAIFMVIGFVACIAIAFTDYRKILMNIAPFFYIGVIILLALVLSPLGVKVNGNTAWLRFGPLGRFQPSEFAKLAVILMLARYLARAQVSGKSEKDNSLTLKDIAYMAGIVAPAALLVRLENDTGTMLTFGAILATFYFVAGMRKTMVLGGVLAIGLGLIVVYPHLKGYQKQRIMAVWQPDKVDPHGFGWQTIQSVIAVGSGGAVGKGITHSTQARLGFLPNAWSDFIGATIAEETGLVGVLVMLLLYLILIWRLISIAYNSRDRAGALMIMGLVGLISFHIACNLGMVVGLMPIMGIPLPLMSQGGTSVIAVFIGLGLALSVRMRRFVN